MLDQHDLGITAPINNDRDRTEGNNDRDRAEGNDNSDRAESIDDHGRQTAVMPGSR